jgi:serine protease Do
MDDDFRMNFDPNRPFLGVLSEKDENGAKITGVTKESAAEKAGLKEGDVITGVNDIKISGPEDLIKTIGTFKPEEKITITYNSKDKKGQKASVVLGKWKGNTMSIQRGFEGMKDFDFEFDGQNRDGLSFRSAAGYPRLGIKAQDLEDGKGAKVLEVDGDSHAEKAGIKAGDIITEFEGEKIDGARELAEAARKTRDKSAVTLKINRGGKSQSIEVKIPKKLRTATL